MSDRATVFQGIQIGLEALGSPGVVVPANKRLLSLDINPSIQTTNQEFGPRGGKYNTIVVNTQEWTAAPVAGVPSVKDLAYVFSGMFGDAVITTPTGATNARQWEWTATQFKADKGRTFTVESGDPDIWADRFANAYFSGYGMNFTRAEVTQSGNIVGKLMSGGVTDRVFMTGNEYVVFSRTGTPTSGTFTVTYGAQTTTGLAFNITGAAFVTALAGLSSIGAGNIELISGGPINTTDIIVRFTGTLAGVNATVFTINNTSLVGGTVTVAVIQDGTTVTDVPLIPLVADNTNIYIDDTYLTFGTTQLDRALQAGFNIADKFGHFWTLDKRQSSFAGRIERKPTADASLQVGADSVGMSLLTPMRSGASKFLRIENIGDAIEAKTPSGFIYYTFQADLCVKVLGPAERADADGLLAQPWNFRVVYSDTAQYAAKFRIIADMTAL